MADPIATQTLYATWIGSIAAIFAALSAVWIAHQANVRDNRRREQEAKDRKLAFQTAVKLAVRKVASMTATLENDGDGAMTRSLFVQGVKSARLAINYALKLGVADATSLEIAFDAGSAFDLLAAMLASLGPEQFVGAALAVTREELRTTMTVLYDKHPPVAPAKVVT